MNATRSSGVDPRMVSGGHKAELPTHRLFVTELLADLRALKAVAMEAELARQWLGPRLMPILDLLPGCDAGTKVLTQLREHGWDEGTQAFSDPTALIDIVRLIGHLQRWLYEKLEQVRAAAHALAYSGLPATNLLLQTGCDAFQVGSGTYSIVHKARNRETAELYAIKKLIHSSEAASGMGTAGGGFTDSVLREISILREMRHDNVVQ